MSEIRLIAGSTRLRPRAYPRPRACHGTTRSSTRPHVFARNEAGACPSRRLMAAARREPHTASGCIATRGAPARGLGRRPRARDPAPPLPLRHAEPASPACVPASAPSGRWKRPKIVPRRPRWWASSARGRGARSRCDPPSASSDLLAVSEMLGHGIEARHPRFRAPRSQSCTRQAHVHERSAGFKVRPCCSIVHGAQAGRLAAPCSAAGHMVQARSRPTRVLLRIERGMSSALRRARCGPQTARARRRSRRRGADGSSGSIESAAARSDEMHRERSRSRTV